MVESIIFSQLVSTGIMTGLIWYVQIVHYPLFSQVSADTFHAYHRAHMQRTTWIVAPVMLVEAGGAFVLPWLLVDFAWAAWTGVAMLVGVWLSTALLQVPDHQRLARDGFSASVGQRLVRMNWLRTALWSGRFVLVCWICLKAFATPG